MIGNEAASATTRETGQAVRPRPRRGRSSRRSSRDSARTGPGLRVDGHRRDAYFVEHCVSSQVNRNGTRRAATQAADRRSARGPRTADSNSRHIGAASPCALSRLPDRSAKLSPDLFAGHYRAHARREALSMEYAGPDACRHAPSRIDGNQYSNCRFESCADPVYRGGEIPHIIDCTFRRLPWQFEDAAERTLQFMNLLYHGMGDHGRELIEAHDRDDSPADAVELDWLPAGCAVSTPRLTAMRKILDQIGRFLGRQLRVPATPWPGCADR